MRQMKTVFAVIVLSLVLSTNLYAALPPCAGYCVDLTIPNASNIPPLVVGEKYARVTLSVLPGQCSGKVGIRMVVTPDTEILVPLPGTYGVQEFGFNYIGDPTSLIIEDPAGWKIKYNQNRSDFGVFLVDDSGKGSNRQNPLTIDICVANSNLEVSDFLVTNTAGYVFVAHIAPFSYEGIPVPGNSSFFATQDATLITLTSFIAEPLNGSVFLFWETASEIDNVGFNLYRSESNNGAFSLLNDDIIIAEGSPTEGMAYEFIDENVQNRTTYYYMLEDLDIYGISTYHGPVSATPRLIFGGINR